MNNSSICKTVLAFNCLLFGLPAWAQLPPQDVLNLSYKVGTPVFPVAAYQNMSVSEFRSMVRKSFQSAGFSFVAVDEKRDSSTSMRFELDANQKIEVKPKILVVADELLDSKRRCNPCFLRFAEVSNAPEIKKIPWMLQYELSSLLVPAIDKAYSIIEVAGRDNQDPSFGFKYKPQWAGEKNLFGNSFAGLTLPDLKEHIVQAYRAAGFVPVDREKDPRASELELMFIFPIDPAKVDGAIYKVKIRSQYTAGGHCHPCEVAEQYDPYQQLPAAGLAGVLNRATLESRFSAARNAAHENIRVDLENYLRPRSGFSVPIKPAALGSSRPPPAPVAAT